MNKLLVSNFAASLFALLNSFRVMPIFIGYVAKEKRSVQRLLALFVSLTVLILLLLFFFTGSSLLKFFGISLDSFRIAGGIILLIIGIGIVNGNSSKSLQEELSSQEQISDFRAAEEVYRKIVIPLAMPLLVGPGVIANVILYASEAEAKKDYSLYFGLITTIILISVLNFIIFMSGRWLQKALGDIGLNIITRILGLLVASMGVQFMIIGLSRIIVDSIAPEILNKIGSQ
jgi:MarC family membrane protein